MLQLLLRCQSLLDEVRVEPAQAKDKDAEKNSDKGTDHAGPVLLEDLEEDLSAVKVCVVWIVSHLMEVHDQVRDAKSREEYDCQRQVKHKYVKETTCKRHRLAIRPLEDGITYL